MTLSEVTQAATVAVVMLTGAVVTVVSPVLTAVAQVGGVESFWPNSVIGWLTFATHVGAVLREIARSYKASQSPTERRFRAQRRRLQRLERDVAGLRGTLEGNRRDVAGLMGAQQWDGHTERRHQRRRGDDPAPEQHQRPDDSREDRHA